MEEKLNPKDTTHVKLVMGTFLYQNRIIDGTMLPYLNDIGTAQVYSTVKTQQKTQRLMDSNNW